MPYIALEDVSPLAESPVCSGYFGTRIAELDSLKKALSSYVERAAEKMHTKRLLAGME
jgi:hypothetical protein